MFLLLFGHLPDNNEYQTFKNMLSKNISLPKDFLELNILRTPGKNIMNKIQQSILMLYAYDNDADNVSAYNTLIQGLSLIAKMPSIISYSYQSKIHNYDNKSLIIHNVNGNETISQSLLRLTRSDGHYSKVEAETLDCMLVLHADHGGGNNSTFQRELICTQQWLQV